MNFTGTEEYVATNELQLAVNAAISLQKPLLIKGEPGTGKTMLAEQIAKSLNLPLISGISNQRQRRSKAYMNTMRSHDCAIRS